MMISTEQSMREIVLQNSGAAMVLEQYGLDYCCQGQQTLAAACAAKNVDSVRLLGELSRLEPGEGGGRYSEWDPAFLADYILNNHHTYVKRTIPAIRTHLAKIVGVHGTRHPEFAEVERLFGNLSAALERHLLKEERVLFPYVKFLSAAAISGGKLPAPPFGSVGNPIAVMETEHTEAGADLERMRELLDNYRLPEDACTTVQLTYQELEEFERDLHRHVFLENAVLFPKALELEKESAGQDIVPS